MHTITPRATITIGLTALFGITTLTSTATADVPRANDVVLAFNAGGHFATPDLALGELGMQLTTKYLDVGFLTRRGTAPTAIGERTSTDWAIRLGHHIGWTGKTTYTSDDYSEDSLWRIKRFTVLHIYGDVQLIRQRRNGRSFSTTGYAGSVEIGARGWLCSSIGCFGAGLGLRYQLHFTDYQLGSAVVPQWSSMIATPISVSIGYGGKI